MVFINGPKVQTNNQLAIYCGDRLCKRKACIVGLARLWINRPARCVRVAIDATGNIMTILLEGCHGLSKWCIFSARRCTNPCQDKVSVEVAADIAICTWHHFNTHTRDVFVYCIQSYGVAVLCRVCAGDNNRRCGICGQFCAAGSGSRCDSSGQPGWLDAG